MTPIQVCQVVEAIREAQLLGPGEWRRPPPIDEQCEMRVAAALVSGATLPVWLTPDCFVVPIYCAIAHAAEGCRIAGSTLTAESVLEGLSNAGYLDERVADHVHEMVGIRMPASYLENDGRRLLTLARRRRGLERVHVLTALLYEPASTDSDVGAAVRSVVEELHA